MVLRYICLGDIKTKVDQLVVLNPRQTFCRKSRRRPVHCLCWKQDYDSGRSVGIFAASRRKPLREREPYAISTE